MSLINDALRKARQEITEQDAKRDDLRMVQAPAHYKRPLSAPGPVLAIGAIVVIMLGIGAVAWVFSLIEPKQAAATATTQTGALQVSVSERVNGPHVGESNVIKLNDAQRTTGVEKVDGPTAIETVIAVVKTPQHGESAAEKMQGDKATEAATVIEPVEQVTSVSQPIPTRTGGAGGTGGASTTRVEAGRTYMTHVDIGDDVRLRLDAIAWSPRNPVAMINGSMMTTGEDVDGVRVVKIERKRVVLRVEGRTFYLRLP